MDTTALTLPPLIPFNKGGTWGFCTPERDVVIPCEYDFVRFFHIVKSEHGLQQRAIVRLGHTPQEWRYGMIDETGQVRILLDYADLEPFSCGFARVRLPEKTLYAFIDALGQPLTHNEFATAQSFSEGLAYVSKPVKKRVEEHGFIDTQGVMRISGTMLFDDATPFENGFSVVTHYAPRFYFYSYLKKDGTFLTARKDTNDNRNFDWFSSASPFQDSRALVYGELTGFAIIDDAGMIIADLEYTFDAAYPARGGLIRVEKGMNTGFLDTDGNEVIPCIVDYAKVADFSCGLAAFQETSGGLWGFLDASLNVVIPPNYEEVSDFAEGFAVVKRNDLYGFINVQGEEVITPKYAYASSFEAGFALVRNNGMRFYIDRNGVEFVA